MLFTFCSPGSSDVFTEHFVTLYIYIYMCCSPFVHQAVQMFSLSTLSLFIYIYIYMLLTFCSPSSSDVFTEHFVTLHIYIYMLFTFCSPDSSDVFTEHFVTLYIYICVVHQAVQMFSLSTLSLFIYIYIYICCSPFVHQAV